MTLPEAVDLALKQNSDLKNHPGELQEGRFMQPGRVRTPAAG